MITATVKVNAPFRKLFPHARKEEHDCSCHGYTKVFRVHTPSFVSRGNRMEPKVMLGRVALRILPESSLYVIKKHYYSYLISHRPESWMEEDAVLCAKLLPPVSFIKCDAEYHELWVLRGGLQTLRRDHPAMLIEVNPDPDDVTTSAFETFELLQNEGYEVYRFDGEHLHLRKPGEQSRNYFFLMPGHLKKLQPSLRFAA